MIHAEGQFYDHEAFRPWRLQALAFKAIRNLYPDYEIWRDFAYEYEFDRACDRRHQRRTGLARMGRRCRSGSRAISMRLQRADEASWREEVADLLLY